MPELDFVEKASIWTFAGLLAISATPAAAIAFITIAPSFVVAMRTGDIGAVIKWYVDGNPAATVDTHSDVDGIVRVTLVGDPDLDEHQIYAVKDDEEGTTASIVRKELSETEARPANTRYNDDCSCVQTFDGTDWTDNPAADPRTSAAYQFPPPATADPACDAAARIVAAIQRTLATMFEAAGILEAINAMIAVVAVFFPPVALFIALLFALVNAANAIGFAAVALAFTDDVYAQLLCLIDCHIGADGQFDDAEWGDFQDDVGATFGVSTVTAILALMFNGLGMVGFNNMASKGTETGACDDCACGWTWCWLGGDGLGDWLTPVSALGKTAGVYNSGLDTIDGTEINAEHNVWANFYYEQDLHIKQVRLVFDNVNAGGSGSTDSSYNCQTDLGLDSFGYSDAGMVDNEYTFTLNEDVHWIQFVMTAQVSMRIKRIEMQGTGDTPTTGVDCTP